MRAVQEITVIFLSLLAAMTACGIDTGTRARRGSSGAANAAGQANAGGSTAVVLDMPEDNAAGATLAAKDACVSDTIVGEHVPLDIYMMVDKSGSMRCRLDQSECQTPAATDQSRWGIVARALKSFMVASENAGIGVGLGFFPVGYEKQACLEQCAQSKASCDCFVACGCAKQDCACGLPETDGSCFCAELHPPAKCDASWYDLPAAPIALLPDAASSLNAKIDEQGLFGGTPTVGALKGALTHAREWAEDHPARRVAVVFATDGEPQDCGDANTITAAAASARAAFEQAPSIPTYVIGVGQRLDNLDEIARAGGTQSAYLLPSVGDDVLTEFTQALNSIRGRALSCDYKIPNKRDLDYARVNVQVLIGGTTTPKVIGQAASRAACADADGWFYDDPKLPTQLTLCRKTCDEMAAAAGSKLEVLMGCVTQRLDPR